MATVPIGYADGVPRRLSSVGGEVLIRGKRYPYAGTVTMDQVVIDVGTDPVEVGDDVPSHAPGAEQGLHLAAPELDARVVGQRRGEVRAEARAIHGQRAAGRHRNAPALARGLFCLSRSVGILSHAFEQMQQGGRNKGPTPPAYRWTYEANR